MMKRKQPKKRSPFVEEYLSKKTAKVNWGAKIIRQVFPRRLDLISRFGEGHSIKLSKDLGLTIEPWMRDTGLTHPATFGPILNLSIKPVGVLEGKGVLNPHHYHEHRGALGFVTLNFAKCKGEKKYSAFIHAFQNRGGFQRLPAASKRKLSKWEDKVLQALEAKLKEMGVKRLALISEKDPYLEEVPAALRKRFYQEMPARHKYKNRKLKVVLVDYLKALLAEPPTYQTFEQDLEYQVKEL
jgi:hypothetical protein